LPQRLVSRYERAIDADAGKASYLTNAAAALASLGRRRDACDRCLAAAALEPRFERARSRLGTIASTAEGFEDALAAALKAAAEKPSRCGHD
jgi:tetratricopeptide (TPR) repeat protein